MPHVNLLVPSPSFGSENSLIHETRTTRLQGSEDRADALPKIPSLLSPQREDSGDLRFATRKQFSWFPGADPDHEVAQTFRTWSAKRSVILATCCAVSSFVFVVNLATTVTFRTSYKSEDGDLGTLYHGDCGTSSQLSTRLHLLINLLSTLLIGSSNFCMQLLVAPTRAEVDKAHNEHRWLDIGVPSIDNLKSIPYKRRILWAMLGLSSVPLHFL